MKHIKNYAFMLIFATLMIVSVIPLWLSKYLPSVNLPSYLLMSQIIQKISDPAFDFARYYSVNLSFRPLLAYFYFVKLFEGILNPIIATKLFITLCFFMLPLSFYVFLSSIDRRIKWLSVFAFIFLYNQNYYYGNLNMMLAIPLIFFGIATLERLWINFKPLLLILFIIQLITMFIAHPFGYLLFFLSAIIVSIQYLGIRSCNKTYEKYLICLTLFVSLILYLPYAGTILSYINIFFNKSLAEKIFTLGWLHPYIILKNLITSPFGQVHGLVKILYSGLILAALLHPFLDKKCFSNIADTFTKNEYFSQKKYIYVVIFLIVFTCLIPLHVVSVEYKPFDIKPLAFFYLNIQFIPLIVLLIVSLFPYAMFEVRLSRFVMPVVVIGVISLTYVAHRSFQNEIKPFSELSDYLPDHQKIMCMDNSQTSENYASLYKIMVYLCNYYSYSKGGQVTPFPDNIMMPVTVLPDAKPLLTFNFGKDKLSKDTMNYYDKFVFRTPDLNLLPKNAMETTDKFFKIGGFSRTKDFGEWHVYERVAHKKRK